MVSTGNRIKARREQLGLSRSELAERLGVTRLKVWRVETGAIQVPADHLANWADALETKPAELVA